MNQNEFLALLKDEVLDTDCDISMDCLLEDIDEWDSLSIVSFIAMASAECGKKITRQSIMDAKQVKDLYLLVK